MIKDKSRKPRRQSYTKRQNLGLELSCFEPLTVNQVTVFESQKNVVLHGSAGTGKTFMSMYLGLEDIIREEAYSKLVIIRSIVATRDIGFLPGTEKDKIQVYETPYMDIASELFNNGTAYDVLKTKGIIHFMPTSFIRGTTLRDAVVIIDECQNMSYHELDSIITRIGDNCRVFFCGDFAQTDLKGNGIKSFYDVLKVMNEFDFVNFTVDDIVRSEFVKSYLIAKYATHGDKQLP